LPQQFGVIFDMDGVLVDSFHAHLKSWQVAAHKHGLEMTEADFNRTFGRTSRDIIAMLWPGKFNETQSTEFDAIKESAYRDGLVEHFPEMDGAGDLLASLHAAGFGMAIGSSGPPQNVAVVCKCLPNGNYITATVNGWEVTRGKPDPMVFLLAAKKLGIDPKNCAVVEDAVVGVDAAKRAGMLSIGLLGTASPEALGVHAHWVIPSLRELTPAKIAAKIKERQTA
jgi:beta-phosphoglucomutase